MSVASTVSGLLSGVLLAIRSVGFSLSEIPVSASIRVWPPALRRVGETKCGRVGSPARGGAGRRWASAAGVHPCAAHLEFAVNRFGDRAHRGKAIDAHAQVDLI